MKLIKEDIAENYDYISDTESIPVGWSELTSLEDWDLYWGETRLLQKFARDKIKVIVATETNMFQNWATYPEDKKHIACHWIAAPYSLRMTYHTDAEDTVIWDDLVGYTEKNRTVIVERMRLYISELSRTEDLTIQESQQFYYDITNADVGHNLLELFMKTNCPRFSWWMNNTVGTDYENDGFEQRAYYNETIRDNVNLIYTGEVEHV